jgi:ankyrin repeat protein
MEASGSGHIDIVRLLVDAKADVNAKDWVSYTTHDY